MCLPLPQKAPFTSRHGMVSGYESRSSPYPPAKVFLAQFGTVSDWSYPEALSRLYAVELLAVWFYRLIAERLSRVRLPASPQTNSLPGLALSEPDGTCTRIAASGFGPNPAGGLVRQGRHHPLGLTRLTKRESFPVAQFLYERTRRTLPDDGLPARLKKLRRGHVQANSPFV